ncbi:6-carboxytetrahydropterin synthase [Mycobacterium asiaticum]|uniref:6-carboxytetrahydropterin synthase n=1 Tax=Mycobacterium asiaticum TaxID=1790 RepID=UPI0009BDD0A5|nr:6-carboxytetrahydropterin synthase [Mycobacterium asiaticum]
MTTLAFEFPDTVQSATLHRDDAPPGRTAKFHLRKRFSDLACCHRSWSGAGKNFFLHGYEQRFEIEFACAELDPDTGMVVDADCLEQVRNALRRQFDHTTLIAAEDPQRDLFELLAAQGAIDLRVMHCPGMEASAAWVFDTVERIVAKASGGRVWVSRVEARENRNNRVTLMAD